MVVVAGGGQVLDSDLMWWAKASRQGRSWDHQVSWWSRLLVVPPGDPPAPSGRKDR